MTALADVLRRQIRAEGPMTLSDYMTTCLTHPTLGYYTARDPLGAAGDFTTAPEISQMFGELVGLALAQHWMDNGRPAQVTLAELGPGRGTLMADCLRATARVPGFRDAIQLHLVEVSPTLQKRQKEALPGIDISWCGTVRDLPEAPLYLIANEYFDALPIRQFRHETNGWSERMVGLDEAGALTFGWSPAVPLGALQDRLGDTTPGDIIEVNAQARADATDLANRIATFGGTGIIVDYGDSRSLGDTFQALRNHRFEGPLANPGEADLTAHVDFGALAQCAQDAGAATSAITHQGVFLERLGITERARQLATSLSGSALDTHIAAHRRLTHPEEMGHLFKAMSIHRANATPPPGLD